MSSIELIGGDHAERKNPDAVTRRPIHLERMSDLHCRRRSRADQHIGGYNRDTFASDVAEMTILQGTPMCKAGSPELDPNSNHPVAITGICHRKLAAQVNYPLPCESGRIPSRERSFHQHELPVRSPDNENLKATNHAKC